MLQGLFLVFSAAVIVANFVADLLYVALDPRVRTMSSTPSPPRAGSRGCAAGGAGRRMGRSTGTAAGA